MFVDGRMGFNTYTVTDFPKLTVVVVDSHEIMIVVVQ